MKLDSLNKLFIDELQDLYDAENQIVKALPKMVKAASHPELKQAFEQHLEETQGQVKRLEQIFERFEEGAKPKTCKGMKGLLEEGSERIKSDGDPAVIDAALIAAAQRVEHYEIAAYGCARTYAELLGDETAAELLQQSLDEEFGADEKLNDLAKSLVNLEAAEA